MIEDQPPQDLPNAGALLGGITAIVGIVGAVAIYRHPDSLQVPLWLAMTACFCFVLSGLALSLKASRFTRLFQWTIVALLLCMASIPTWLAFGNGIGTCTASLPLIGSPFACRLAFGISAALVIVFLAAVTRLAVRGPAV